MRSAAAGQVGNEVMHVLTVALERAPGREVQVANDLVDVDVAGDVTALCVLFFDLFRPSLFDALRAEDARRIMSAPSEAELHRLPAYLVNMIRVGKTPSPANVGLLDILARVAAALLARVAPVA